jgi:tetratricopeptide (TPR) repeat protein
MSMPGNAYLEHSGRVRPWPEDSEGRYLPLYADNNFGGHKSYHVVGELNDFFGGYYRDEDYGFGHWARYEEMPGQKLWLWALSRAGGVWEDLLTDTDGQYVEFQAGRLFVQYSPGAHTNPITQAGFDPMSASRWSETWFPLEGTGGLTDASRDGALFASEDGGRVTVGINAFRPIRDTLKVWSDGDLISTTPLILEPLEPLGTAFDVTPGRPYRVQLQRLGLDYQSDPTERSLARPFETDPAAFSNMPETDWNVFQARELMKGRRYVQARALFETVLDDEPWNRVALLGLAELSQRRGFPDQGLDHVNRVLQLDAYDAEANFLAGTLYRALGHTADARDAFGWAARSVAFRTAAYSQLAEISLEEESWAEATRYARLAIDFDRHSIPGWRALAVIGRRTGDAVLAQEARTELLSLDPLHHFARAEAFLAGQLSAEDLLGTMGGEYPDQTLLELALWHERNRGRSDALALLELGESGGMGWNPLLRAWRAWLEGSPQLLGQVPDPAFVFPYRPETLPVLEWAAENSGGWVWQYLLALNLWAVDRAEEAGDIMHGLLREAGFARRPHFPPAWVAQALLLEETHGMPPQFGLWTPVSADPDNRILHIYLVQALEDAGDWEGALRALDEARNHIADDFNMDLLRAKALVNLDRGTEAVEVLASTHVLPSENARESHSLWEQAHTIVALDAYETEDHQTAKEHLLAALEWPENLGQGRPYDPDERLIRYILGRVEDKLGNPAAAAAAFDAFMEAMGEIELPLQRLDLLAIRVMGDRGRRAEAEELLYADNPARLALLGSIEDDLEGRLIWRAFGLDLEGR